MKFVESKAEPMKVDSSPFEVNANYAELAQLFEINVIEVEESEVIS